MERLDVFDYSNVLIASYFTDDRGCAHENREHTLIYLCSVELEIEERGKKTVLHPGDCAFMRRDNRMWLQKHVKEGEPYHSIVLKFSRAFLREFYQTHDHRQLPADSMREKSEPAYITGKQAGYPIAVRIGHSLFRCGRKAIGRSTETEDDRRRICVAQYRQESLCLAVRFCRAVED